MTLEDRMQRLLRVYSMLLTEDVEISIVLGKGAWFVELHADEVPMPDVFVERAHTVNVDDWTVVLGCNHTLETTFRDAERVTCGVIGTYLSGTFHSFYVIPDGHTLLSELLHELRASANGEST